MLEERRMLYEEKTIETIPVGPLGLIPLKSCKELGDKVNDYLVSWRQERESEHKSTIAFSGYQREPARQGSEPAKQRVPCRNPYGVMTFISWWMCAITALRIPCAV